MGQKLLVIKIPVSNAVQQKKLALADSAVTGLIGGSSLSQNHLCQEFLLRSLPGSLRRILLAGRQDADRSGGKSLMRQETVKLDG